jgi:hypothetical protein
MHRSTGQDRGAMTASAASIDLGRAERQHFGGDVKHDGVEPCERDVLPTISVAGKSQVLFLDGCSSQVVAIKLDKIESAKQGGMVMRR